MADKDDGTPGTGFFGRLLGGKDLEDREAATRRRIATTQRLEARCDGRSSCAPDSEQGPGEPRPAP